ncbi:glycosyl transferase [Brasilonema octagenarum UFV-E1]|uniref:Glycosyl transferase n=1 Tax=Brasilonema sennae CENA114 TaxID=415709 RepID=A0A856M718_9CYAN|nr:glycosyltransferase family 2 protein [Brasilonema sennae]QDL06943.1 glycosyl transferase [Brasilonema sennae CENA114]QDL13306.1 glycosyl transferase [Brasilonema octagenarum UFV-E1]
MSISQFMASFTDVVLLVSASGLFIVCLFFLIECTAALLRITSDINKDNSQDLKVSVLVPAHNEEIVIGSTIEKLLPTLNRQDSLVVVADNCSDTTAEIARAKGATVIERHDLERKGKGYALDYGLEFMESAPPDVVVIVDADCTVEPDAISLLTQRAIALRAPVQATYLMSRPKNSQSSKDFVSQFSNIVRNLVRPRGLARLGQSCPLLGTGMAFPWTVIRSVNLANSHLLEDLKLGLDLTLAGHRPVFCPEAKVTGYLPQQSQAAKSQRTRWDHGHLQIMQTYVPILLKQAVFQKRFDLLVSVLDLCVPPLSLLVVMWLVLMALSLVFGVLAASWMPAVIVATAGLCFLIAILIAWTKFARQDLPLRELLTVPFYILWKIPVYFKFLVKPQSVWVRTERDSVNPTDS